MDGYSVNEAAAVLGIPEARVWELLARGVLAGSTEVGGDMRVLLRDAAVPESPKPVPPSNGNGHGSTNGGSSGGEFSAFRELLTEFRNLTERYGQALLALGESRGEVASLRGRVELLETRMELRLAAAAPMTAWTAPEVPPAEASDEPVELTDEAAPDLDSEFASGPVAAAAQTLPRRTPRPTPRQRKRSRTAGFAEALARAEDPSSSPVGEIDESLLDTAPPLPQSPLPGAEETAAALAALHDEAPSLVSQPDATPELTTEPEAQPEPVRQSVPVMAPVVTVVEQTDPPAPPAAHLAAVLEAPAPEPAEPEQPVFARAGYGTDTPEPDWIAEEDLIVPAASAPSATRRESLAPAAEEAPTATAVAVAEPERVAERAAAPAERHAPDPWPPISPLPTVELAAEPPAPDDAPLLEVDGPFAEPPMLPSEPAFWEPEGRARAPFAMPLLDAWEPDEVDQLRAELSQPVVLEGPSTMVPVMPPPIERPVERPAEPAPVIAAEAPPIRVASAESALAALEPAAPPEAPEAPEASETIEPPIPEPVPGAPKGQRGPAARAVRRLRRIWG